MLKLRILSSHLLKSITNRKNCYTTIAPPPKMTKIVWVDLEMTGLNVETDQIMEIACTITDNNLNIIEEHPSIVIHQPESVLNAMGEWCTTTHTKTGLLDACKTSTITLGQAENEVLNFIKQHTEAKQSPLAGNSVYCDRMFLVKYMPRINDYLHYRIIDVSSVKELCKRWNSKIFSKAPRKKLVHRGTDDIRESINELKFYKQFMFN